MPHVRPTLRPHVLAGHLMLAVAGACGEQVRDNAFTVAVLSVVAVPVWAMAAVVAIVMVAAWIAMAIDPALHDGRGNRGADLC